MSLQDDLTCLNLKYISPMAIFAGVLLENDTWLDINTKEPVGSERKINCY